MPALDSIQTSLLLLTAAAVVLYVGTRLLWAAIPWAGLWRGVLISGPVLAMALYHTPHSPGTAIAMLVSTAVLAMTLGLGVSTVDLPGEASEGSPMLRLLLPLAGVVCLCGFHGEMSAFQAAAIAVVAGLTLWTAAGERQTPRAAAAALLGLPAVLILAGGLILLVMAVKKFTHAGGASALTPIVVLLTVPAMLLGLLGLLSAEGREHRPDTPQETCVGLTIASLGFGLPLVFLLNAVWPFVAGHLPSRVATTQPTTWPTVTIPLATWRVDSVMLVVVSILLLPIGSGRFKLGRAEGAFLILLYLAYAAVATRTGAIVG